MRPPGSSASMSKVTRAGRSSRVGDHHVEIIYVWMTACK